MRNFRTAALAASTAVAVSFAGTAVASASLSSEVGDKVEADDRVTGVDLLGSETNDKNNPEWSMIWRDVTYAGIAVSVIGAIIGAYNFAVYNNIVPGHFLDPMFRK